MLNIHGPFCHVLLRDVDWVVNQLVLGTVVGVAIHHYGLVEAGAIVAVCDEAVVGFTLLAM